MPGSEDETDDVTGSGAVVGRFRFGVVPGIVEVVEDAAPLPVRIIDLPGAGGLCLGTLLETSDFTDEIEDDTSFRFIPCALILVVLLDGAFSVVALLVVVVPTLISAVVGWLASTGRVARVLVSEFFVSDASIAFVESIIVKDSFLGSFSSWAVVTVVVTTADSATEEVGLSIVSFSFLLALAIPAMIDFTLAIIR